MKPLNFISVESENREFVNRIGFDTSDFLDNFAKSEIVDLPLSNYCAIVMLWHLYGHKVYVGDCDFGPYDAKPYITMDLDNAKVSYMTRAAPISMTGTPARYSRAVSKIFDSGFWYILDPNDSKGLKAPDMTPKRVRYSEIYFSKDPARCYDEAAYIFLSELIKPGGTA